MATYIPGVTDVFPEPSLFTPDFSFIDKMLQRRQKLYEQGFAQINSKYKWIDRNVTNPANQEIKDRFLRDTKQNLKNLSALDLSQVENVNAAMNVFSPFVKNKNVLGDQMITEFWDQQEQIGNSYRLKDGGKEFSEDNVNYIKLQKNAFAQDSADSWGSYYQSRRFYNPYYDYNKEIQEAMKNFKPSSYESFKINGLDVITEKDASAKEADIRRYLEGTLSDKAKKQMGIEAAVRYGTDIPGLAQTYVSESQKEIAINNLNIQKTAKDLATIKDPSQRVVLETYMKNKKEQNEAIAKNIENIKKGDMSYVKQNAESLASAIYYNNVMNRVSNGFSYQDVSFKLSGYESGLALMKEAAADRRQLRGFAHDEYMERYKKKLETAMNAGEFLVETPAVGEGDADVQMTEQAYSNMVETYDGLQSDLMMKAKQHVLAMINADKDEKSKLTINDLTRNRIALWLQSGGPNGQPIPKTDRFYELYNQVKKAEKAKGVYKNVLNNMRTEAFEKLSAEDKATIETTRKKIDASEPVKFVGLGNMSASEIRQGIESGAFQYVPARRSGLDRSAPLNPQIKVVEKDPTNPSKSLREVTYVIADNKSHQTILDIVNSQKTKAYSNLKTNMSDAFSKAGGDKRFIPSRMRPFSGSNADKILNNALSGIFPQFNTQTQGVGISTNNQGDVYYRFSTKGENSAGLTKSQYDQVKNELISRGYGGANGNNVSVIGTEKGGYEIKISGWDNSVTKLFRDFDQDEVLAVQEVATWQSPKKYVGQPFSTKNNKSTEFRIVKEYDNYYLQLDGRSDYIEGGFTDPTDAVKFARSLTKDNNFLLNKVLQTGYGQ